MACNDCSKRETLGKINVLEHELHRAVVLGGFGRTKKALMATLNLFTLTADLLREIVEEEDPEDD